MTSFQIIIVIISAVGLFTSIIGVYIKTQIDITKIQTTILFIQKDLDRKEFSILKVEQQNCDDHKSIINKIDALIKEINQTKN